ncbi:MAG TPA: iron-containing redox enzyme family protein [Burkholderiales bacterium]|nr:iron-containing redox enzyme family protein [Burkholderiales bacterium]
MNFFDKLQEETAAARQELLRVQIIQDALAGRIDVAQYLAFLSQAYHHVRHTVPLLMACGSRLPDRLGWLRTAISEYIEEEIGHEEWILCDIAACGGDPEKVRQSRPALETELMVAYAYHQIDRGNAVGFFGMVHVLEGTSTAIATTAADAIGTNLGLPETAFTYLTSHGNLDVEHVKFFARLMNQVEDGADQQAVIHCARAVYRLYGDIFRALPRGSRRAA